MHCYRTLFCLLSRHRQVCHYQEPDGVVQEQLSLVQELLVGDLWHASK